MSKCQRAVYHSLGSKGALDQITNGDGTNEGGLVGGKEEDEEKSHCQHGFPESNTRAIAPDQISLVYIPSEHSLRAPR